jgi:hypothetical protein
MSPAGNRWNPQAMAQSFTLANVVPQNRENNQRLWARIETSVRGITFRYDDTYVVTGPMFNGQQLQTIGPTRVFVPTQLFKVVYVPSRQMAFAVVVDNISTNRYDIKTVHELEAMSGIRFPGIPESLKDQRNDNDVLNIEGDALTVSNGTTRITLSGTLELTKDQRGLQAALALKQALDRVVETLQAQAHLPERIKDEPDAKPAVTDNPFN